MFDSPTLSVSELAERWQKTPRQILDYALVPGVPLYLPFEGLVFDVNDDWHRHGGDWQQSRELEALSEKVTGVFGTTAFGMEISARAGDDEAEPVISLYPNPATTHCKVDLEGASGTVEVTVMDAAGKIRWSGSHAIQEQVKSFDLDVTSLSSGVYLVTITSEDGKTRSEKLIISR